jgi:hypothetical protein
VNPPGQGPPFPPPPQPPNQPAPSQPQRTGQLPGPNPWATAAQPAPRQDGSRGTLIVLAGILPAVLLLVASVVNGVLFFTNVKDSSTASTSNVTAGPSRSPAVREPAANDCAKKDGTHFVLAACSPPSMKVLVAGDYTAEAMDVCPDPTDEFGYTRSNDVLCLQHLTSDHPGAPGKGGGVLRAGDCLGNVDVDGFAEIACGPKAFHRITGFTSYSPKKCPPGSVRTLDRPGATGAKSVICGADGDAIASPGECVAWTTGDKAFNEVPVPCSNRPVAKFMGRAKSLTGCEKWHRNGRYYTVARFDLVEPMIYNCYVKLG